MRFLRRFCTMLPALAEPLVEQDLSAGRLVSVLEAFVPTSVTEIHAIYVGQGGHLPARVRALMDFLGANLRVR